MQREVFKMPDIKVAPTIASHKIFSHPERVRSALLDPRHTTPITLDVDPTTSCNSRCPNCTFPDTSRMFLNFDLYRRTVEEASRMGVKAITFTGGGEPTLHPRFMEMVETAKAYGLEVGLITNGLAFSPEIAERALPMLKWVRFSVDAGSPEMYFKTHGLHEKAFAQLTENIKTAGKIKRDRNLNTRLGASYLILGSSMYDAKLAIKLGLAAGLDYLQFKPMQLRDTQILGGYRYDLKVIRDVKGYLESHLTSDLRYLKAEDLDSYNEAFHIYFTRFRPQFLEAGPREYRQSQICFGQRFTTSLAADGRIYGCCHYKYDPDFELGNLHFDSFKAIWGSERRMRFLDGLDPRKRCLQVCKLEGLNELFWENFGGLDAEGILEKMKEIDTQAPVDYPDRNFI
jgi:radical SAM protein with 4Fe4S-binding SPASM domain